MNFPKPFRNIRNPISIALLAVLTVAITLLSGCSIIKPQSKTSNVPPTATRVEASLINAAVSVETSLGVLAQAQASSDPALVDTVPLVTPEGGMGGKIDIDWIGPIAPLMYKIATLTNYKLKVYGNEPAIPVIVTVTRKQVVIADVLKNASLQARNRATVVVFPENKVIELRYKTI